MFEAEAVREPVAETSELAEAAKNEALAGADPERVGLEYVEKDAVPLGQASCERVEVPHDEPVGALEAVCEALDRREKVPSMLLLEEWEALVQAEFCAAVAVAWRGEGEAHGVAETVSPQAMEGEAGALGEPLLLLVAARAPEGLPELLEEVLPPPPLVSEDTRVAVGAPPVAESVGVCETVELAESGGEAVGAAAVADTEAVPGTLALALLPSTRLAEQVRLLDAVPAVVTEAWPVTLACWALPLRDTECVAERVGDRVSAVVNVAPMERCELPLAATVADGTAEGVRRGEGEARSAVGDTEVDTESAGDRDALELNVGTGLGLALAVEVGRPLVALGVSVEQLEALELPDAPCEREGVNVPEALPVAKALLVADTEGEAVGDTQGVTLTDIVRIALNVGEGVGLVLAVRVERP